MIEVSYIFPVFILKVLALIPWVASSALDYHLHPDSGIESSLSPDVFNGSAACFAALYRLYESGAENVVICSVSRIEAPLSGYLVDATGNLAIEGMNYSVFRLGIRDGEEDTEWASTEFVFLAAGFSDSGEAYIYPPFDPEGNFIWEHEFLLDTLEFLSVPERFPR